MYSVYDTGCYKTVFIKVPEWKVLLNKRRDLMFWFVTRQIFKIYTLLQFETTMYLVLLQKKRFKLVNEGCKFFRGL